MPSPLGHSLVALAVANIPLKQRLYNSIYWLLFVLFTANVADADFLAGWFLGDINRFHHGISHSIGMAVIFAFFSSLFAAFLPVERKKVFIVALMVYSSHLLADYLGFDEVEPLGAPFLWPLSDAYYLSPIALFHPVEHGDFGEHTSSVLDKIFSIENAFAAAVELVIVLPLWILTYWISRRG